jgi:nucleotide-binding universal stress UspA family protein
MPKTILLHLDASDQCAQRLAAARSVAARHQATVECLYAVMPRALPQLKTAKQVHVLTWMDEASAPGQRYPHPGADMMVMGGYGTSRARERVLGGATRTILRSMTVPVLMVH